MKLEGSCQCGGVRFTVESAHPVPYQKCCCSICRKIQGGGGYSINISAERATLKVRGEADIATYHAKMDEAGRRTQRSPAERTFCKVCGSGLWLYDKRWPDLLHPYASIIDTPLPVAPEHTIIMLDFKPDWVVANAQKQDQTFGDFPEESIAEWHERTGTVAG